MLSETSLGGRSVIHIENSVGNESRQLDLARKKLAREDHTYHYKELPENLDEETRRAAAFVHIVANSKEFHQLMLDNPGSPLTPDIVASFIGIHGESDLGTYSALLNRVSLFLSYGIDIEVALLKVQGFCNVINSNLISVIKDDQSLQGKFLNVCKNSVTPELGVFDVNMVEEMLNTWSEKAGLDTQSKEKLQYQFFNKDLSYPYNNETGILNEGRLEMIRESLSRFGFEGEDLPDKVVKNNLIGEHGVISQQARKLEIVIAAMKAEMLVENPPGNVTYTVGKEVPGHGVSYSINSKTQSVNIGIGSEVKIKTDGNWLGEPPKNKNSFFRNLWSEMAVTLSHEYSHLEFTSEVGRFPGTFIGGKIFDDKNVLISRNVEYFDTLYSVLDEGFAIMNEVKTSDRCNKYPDPDGVAFGFNGRQFNDAVDSHYDLGFRILKCFKGEERLLLGLDVAKITDRNSRRLFETTRFSDDGAREVLRKVWVEGEGVMNLVWQKDKCDTLLDYLSSDDPVKIKKGKEKFMELFGKKLG